MAVAVHKFPEKLSRMTNLIAKALLALIGVLYLSLAIWCSVSPDETSRKVGFQLLPGSGESEFLVVYGGLELGLALLFLMPLIRGDSLAYSLLACVLIHGSLVAFRTVSFFLYSGIGSMTYNLAVGEWVIFILTLICLVKLDRIGSRFGSSTK